MSIFGSARLCKFLIVQFGWIMLLSVMAVLFEQLWLGVRLTCL